MAEEVKNGFYYKGNKLSDCVVRDVSIYIDLDKREFNRYIENGKPTQKTDLFKFSNEPLSFYYKEPSNDDRDDEYIDGYRNNNKNIFLNKMNYPLPDTRNSVFSCSSNKFIINDEEFNLSFPITLKLSNFILTVTSKYSDLSEEIQYNSRVLYLITEKKGNDGSYDTSEVDFSENHFYIKENSIYGGSCGSVVYYEIPENISVTLHDTTILTIDGDYYKCDISTTGNITGKRYFDEKIGFTTEDIKNNSLAINYHSTGSGGVSLATSSLLDPYRNHQKFYIRNAFHTLSRDWHEYNWHNSAQNYISTNGYMEGGRGILDKFSIGNGGEAGMGFKIYYTKTKTIYNKKTIFTISLTWKTGTTYIEDKETVGKITIDNSYYKLVSSPSTPNISVVNDLYKYGYYENSDVYIPNFDDLVITVTGDNSLEEKIRRNMPNTTEIGKYFFNVDTGILTFSSLSNKLFTQPNTTLIIEIPFLINEKTTLSGYFLKNYEIDDQDTHKNTAIGISGFIVPPPLYI